MNDFQKVRDPLLVDFVRVWPLKLRSLPSPKECPDLTKMISMNCLTTWG